MLTTEKSDKQWIVKEGENPIWTLNKKLSKEELEELDNLLKLNRVNAARAITKSILSDFSGYMLGKL